MTEALQKPGGLRFGRSKRGADRTPVRGSAPAGGTKPAKDVKALAIGGVPRADLLPVEVLVHRRQRALVRRAWFGVVVVGAVVVAGVGLSTMDSMTAASQLRTAQEAGTSLLQQQGQYSDVRELESSIGVAEAAQAVGGSTEIDWSTYLTKVQSSLPTGVSIVGVTIDSATPLETYDQATTPLQGARVATLTFQADSPTLPSIPDWLDRLHGLPGFVDANANAVTLASDTGHYTVDMTVHIDQKAYDGKYTEQKQ